MRISYLKKNVLKKLSTKIIRRNIYYLQTLFKTNYVPIYQPKDWDGDVIKSYLRNNELQKVEVEADHLYQIDQILIRRTKTKVKEVLVSCLGWPKQSIRGYQNIL